MLKATTRIYLLFLLISFSCKRKPTIVTIQPLDKDTSFLIKSNASRPTNVVLEITGNASDSFLLQHYLKIAGGKLKEKYILDFYADTFHLKYQPYKATKGEIKIEVSFPN